MPPIPTHAAPRNAGLDVLRFLAVVLVLCRHFQQPRGVVLQTLQRGGWIGVDLFFVLSGFLISGLLFTEFERFAVVDLKRFLVRRAFKIYPPFWLLLVLTLSTRVFYLRQSVSTAGLMGELFFLQNYLGGLWDHTWSLAVEEHFYFGLAAVFGFALNRSDRPDFKWIPSGFYWLAATCLVLRLVGWWAEPHFEFMAHLFGTHIRMDSLFYGVFLSYFYHLERGRLTFFRWPASVLVVAGAACLVPAFIFDVERYWFVSALGVVLFYIGSGFLLIAGLRLNTSKNAFVGLLARLGAASYSIYLWHEVVNTWGWAFLQRFLKTDSWYVYSIWYVAGAFTIGYFLGQLIERPILFVRDRFYPSRASRSVIVRISDSPA